MKEKTENKIRMALGIAFALLSAYYLFINYFFYKFLSLWNTIVSVFQAPGNTYSSIGMPVLTIMFLYLLLYIFMILSVYYLFQLRIPRIGFEINGLSVLSLLMFFITVWGIFYMFINWRGNFSFLYFIAFLLLIYSVARVVIEKWHAKAQKKTDNVKLPKVTGIRGHVQGNIQTPPVNPVPNKNVYNTPQNIKTDETRTKDEDFAWYL